MHMGQRQSTMQLGQRPSALQMGQRQSNMQMMMNNPGMIAFNLVPQDLSNPRVKERAWERINLVFFVPSKSYSFAECWNMQMLT